MDDTSQIQPPTSFAELFRTRSGKLSVSVKHYREAATLAFSLYQSGTQSFLDLLEEALPAGAPGWRRFLDLLEEALPAEGPGMGYAAVVVVTAGPGGFSASMVRSTLKSSRAM